MPIWKAYVLTFIEVISCLVLGFIFTENVLRVIYENNGIKFQGNVGINWFGVSYILFFLYTLFLGVIKKDNIMLKERKKSYLFWILFIGSLYAVFIPFIKGENPF